MRLIWPILLVLAGCGPGSGATASSFVSDNCTPQPATIQSIQMWHQGHPMIVGDVVIAGGGQGLPMADLGVRITGDASCVAVSATIGNNHDAGGLQVDASGTLRVLMGPVDTSYSADIDVEGYSAHVDVVASRVTAIR